MAVNLDQKFDAYRKEAEEYGYQIDSERFLINPRTGKRCVQLVIKKGRIRFECDGRLRGSCSVNDGIGWFLERSYYAQKVAA